MLGLDDGVLIRIARVYGENLRRIAQAEPEFYHDHVEGPLLASGMDERQMREAASQMSDPLAEVVQRLLLALYARHQERYTIDHLVSTSRPWSPSSRAPAAAGHVLPRPGRLHPAHRGARRPGGRRPGHQPGRPGRAGVAPHGGQPVKWLGDGVMFHFKRPGQAVVAALEMVERHRPGGAAAGPCRPARRAGGVPGRRLLRPHGEPGRPDRRARRPRPGAGLRPGGGRVRRRRGRLRADRPGAASRASPTRCPLHRAPARPPADEPARPAAAPPAGPAAASRGAGGRPGRGDQP